MPQPQQPSTANPAFRQSYAPTSAYTRHLIASAAQRHYYNNPPPAPSTVRTERDILEEHHRFLRTEEEDATGQTSEEKELARRYYDKLFKEYAVVDLSRWREGMVGMRWRTADEVRKGKGHEMCGALGCKEVDELKVREVDFAYVEEEEQKRALVKVRVCRDCRRKLEKAQDKDKDRDRDRKEESRSRSRRSRSSRRRDEHKRDERRRKDYKSRSRSRSRDRSRSPDRRRHHDEKRERSHQ